jgi:hypothetical protein
MKSNQRHIDRARKNATSNFDERKLDYIQRNSKLNWLSHNAVLDIRFSTPNKIRLPDLLIKGIPEVILEHDTVKLHSELGYENERTHKRNQDYARANRPFFVINEDLAKLLKLDEAALSTYLYFHTLSQWKAYQL